MTAADDPAQLVSEVGNAGVALVAIGPVVVTDLEPSSGSFLQFNVAKGTDGCGSSNLEFATIKDQSVQTIGVSGGGISPRVAIHGARMLVASGSVLCVVGTGAFWWSGFHPYGS